MVGKPGYKQTVVGVIPEDWKVASLLDVVDFTNGKPHEGNVKTDGRFFLITLDSIGIGGSLKSEHKQTDHWDCSLRKNDIVAVLSDIAHGNLLGLCDLIPEDDRYVLNQRMARLRLKVAADPLFVRLQINRRQSHFRQRGQGTSQRHIYRRDFDALDIPFPLDAEQQAIAKALRDADALQGALDLLIAKKRDLKQAAMQQLVTGQTRLPGFHGEWQVKRLGEISRLYQPVTISASLFTESGYPVYGANGVVGFYHDFNHDKWQITITCRGSTCGTVNRTVEKCWITGNAMVVDCGQRNDLNKEFLYYLLLSQDLSVCITGTGQPQIVRGPLANVELCLPREVVEQTAIAAVLTDIDAELAALKQRREKTRALKQAMMQELLTGRTRFI